MYLLYVNHGCDESRFNSIKYILKYSLDRNKNKLKYK